MEMPELAVDTRAEVARSLARAPIIAVVRTPSTAEAGRVARLFLSSAGAGEITFTVPGASRLVRELLAARGAAGPPWIGMGT